jgi:hypothetical protein
MRNIRDSKEERYSLRIKFALLVKLLSQQDLSTVQYVTNVLENLTIIVLGLTTVYPEVILDILICLLFIVL